VFDGVVINNCENSFGVKDYFKRHTFSRYNDLGL
jgi:hypothetical protein